MKRRWLLVTLLVVVLAIGVTGGVVLAQSADSESDSPVKSFIARVAEKLGLEETQVENAFKEATKEMQDETLLDKLEKQVEQGRLTQEEADEYYQWYQSRPDTLTPSMPFGKSGCRGPASGDIRGGKGRHSMNFGTERGNMTPPIATPTPETANETSL